MNDEDEGELFDTLGEALMEAIEISMAEGGADISVCIGPPDCLLQDDDAVQNATDGCPMCRRIRVHSYGTIEESKKVMD